MSQYVDQRTRAWIGRTLLDRSGQRIGRVEDIYTDDVGGHPAWIAVATGRFGLNIIFLPFAGVTPAGGDELRVEFPKSLVRGAPPAGRGGRLTRDEVVLLYDHYGFDLEAEEVRERTKNGPPNPHASGPKPTFSHQQPAPAPPPPPPARTEAPPPVSTERSRPAPPVTPLGARFAAPLAARLATLSAPDEPGTRRDSPLFWDLDDRIDSIRPPRQPAPGRR